LAPPTADGAPAVGAARRLADEVLFPAAMEVDGADAVPRSHLDRLAGAGLYGAAGPGDAGGLELDQAAMGLVVEALAGGCLATAFVWLQHHGLVRNLAAPGPARASSLRDEWLAPLCRGQRRAGIALAGLLPGPPRLRAGRRGDGWEVEGVSPWVSGWGLIDVLLVAARGPGDDVVWLVVDAREGGGLTAERQHLVAVDASRTVHLTFARLSVPAGRHLRTDPYEESSWTGGAGLRLNGSLALGVAGRCCRLIGPSGLDAELEECRSRLDRAGPGGMAEARAAASELAVRAAAALLVRAGSGSILRRDHAQRLYREAAFLLVFGSRAAIRDGLLRRLGAAAS
jgi:alkylation response protein AidB-like acyl-CoA dehydrogenase